MSYTGYNPASQQLLFPAYEVEKKPDDFWIGTSGFAYDDWIETVYPTTVPKKHWFEFYSKMFNALELNMSFYRIPSKKVLESFFKRSASDFLLTLKAHKSMTHDYNLEYVPAFQDFLKLYDSYNRYSQILFQFPFSFHYTDKNFEYLKRLCSHFKSGKAVEFRNSEWLRDDIFKWALEEKITVVSVDEPSLRGLIPRELFETNGIYVRFHGRNSEKWWDHNNAYERYDYLYKKDELMEWINRIKIIPSKPTVFYFNNHYKGQAVRNARLFSELLKKKKEESEQ